MNVDLGQVTAYVGGSGVSVVSLSSKAAPVATPETITLLQVPVPVVQVTIGDVVAIGGFLVVLARFGWDIWRWRRKHVKR